MVLPAHNDCTGAAHFIDRFILGSETASGAENGLNNG